MSSFVGGINFITEECCNCGMSFAMTDDFRKQRLNDHKSFYCPKGHSQYYSGKPEEQKLKEELQRKQTALNNKIQENSLLKDQRNRVKNSYNRMRERIKNGVCPCCNRSFDNLLRHIKSKHPEFGEHDRFKMIREQFGLSQIAVANEIQIPSSYISLYERQKPVPGYAKDEIEQWIISNAS
jgi:DNA-binding XRE family transcriptional regulator